MLRADLDNVRNDLIDERTGLLPGGAVRSRLDPELEWSRHEHVGVGLVVVRIRGAWLVAAAQELLRNLREHENAFLIGRDRVLVCLWDVDEAGMRQALERIGDSIHGCGAPVVEAGCALHPDDGDDVETLLAIAQQDLRPIDQQPALGHGTPRQLMSRVGLIRRSAGSAIAALLIGLVALCVTYGVIPLAFQLRTERLAAAVTLAGVVGLVAATMVALTWNRSWTELIRSKGQRTIGVPGLVGIALAVALLLAWSLVWPMAPKKLPPVFGASMAFTVLLSATLIQARQMLRVSLAALVPLMVLCVGVVVVATPHASLVADVARIVLAVSCAAAFARSFERLWWFGTVALATGAADAWSVLSRNGVTNRLIEHDMATTSLSALDYALLSGPRIRGFSILSIGTTDLFFAALFACAAHMFRVDLRRVVVAIVIALAGALAISWATHDFVPVLPLLGLAFVACAAPEMLVDIRRSIAGDGEAVVTAMSRDDGTTTSAG